MISIPISYYPMPSDDKSQAQALQEQKSELRDKGQVIEQSDMSEEEKNCKLSENEEQTSEVNKEIRDKLTSSDIKKHLDNEKATQTQIEKNEAKKETDRRKLDMLA